ncbi:MAG: LysR family transcriptional regulator [Alphaproteobacteria bacterium]|nr:LysR family transcriptional regulator [Alphaproteobacteria bacterium]
MEIYQLVHFVAIVETGSFTKGAERAHVSQSAISISIAKLEAEFSLKLLDRRRIPVVPTAAGERLVKASEAILQICNEIKGELAIIAKPNTLRIGALQSISNRRVSDLLVSFRRINPHVAIEVADGSYEQLVELLAEQQLDAVLTILDDNAAKFPSRVLFKEPYVLAIPLDHRLAKRECVTLADLHDEPFIVRDGHDKFQDVSNALISRGVKIRVVYRTSQLERTLALVSAGVGLSFIPARLGTPAVNLVQVADMDFYRTYGLLWSHEREEDLKAFIKFAESHLWTS